MLSAVTMGMMERAGGPYKVPPTSCHHHQQRYVEVPQAEQLNEVCVGIPVHPPPPSSGGGIPLPPPPPPPGTPPAGGDHTAPRRLPSSSSSDNNSMTAGEYPASNSGADVCRICHCESEPDAPLISPCICSGSLKYVHQACLQQWIKSADTKSCELCKYNFTMTTKIKPFRKWQKLEMSTVERRKMMCSVTFHIIAITCVVWSLYVLIDRTTEEVKIGVLEWPFWTKLIVVAIGFTGGLVFMYVQCKMYVQLCRRWRAYNRVIFIQNIPELGRAGIRKQNSSVLSSTHRDVEKNVAIVDPNQNRGVQETELF